MPDFDQFLQTLRVALNHLYDPDYLRRSDLANWLGVANRYDTPSAMQSILIKAIEATRPAQKSPLLLSEQQNYDVLLYRYIQQSSQLEVSHQLGVSPRQLRRIQAIALELLATSLWKTYTQDALPGDSYPSQVSKTTIPPDAGLTDDFAWLKDAPVTSPADPEEITRSSLGMLQSLAKRHDVQLTYQIKNSLPALAVHPIAFRQILLSLLGDVIRSVNASHFEISIEQVGTEVCFGIHCFPQDAYSTINLESKGIQDARQITFLSKGRLAWSGNPAGTLVKLFLPAIDQVKILAIDDNTDIIELMQRYIAGTRYILSGVSRSTEALQIIQSEKPRLIVLDVMIPELDGWELLGQIQHHPLTSHIPIIICSILAQEEFALTLGAADFIQKPVRRDVLLQVLDRVAAKLAPEFP